MDKVLDKKKSLFSTSGFTSFLWDLFCLSSVVGIWPRFIEPKLLFTTCKKLPIPNLPNDLKGFKILQFTDLHLHSGTSRRHLKTILNTIHSLNPDLIVFTGDFLCYGEVVMPSELKCFLNALSAPFGCYAVPGNHDYEGYICVNEKGEYDVARPPKSTVFRGFLRLVQSTTLTKTSTINAKNAALNKTLLKLLRQTPFKLLDNESIDIKVGSSGINLCGLGEHMAGKIKIEQAFKNYNPNHPGIILLHNPDGISALEDVPGDVILCGHTHGGQINLPFIAKKFCMMENPKFKKGIHQAFGKWIYINRGVGGTLPFRFLAPPELLLLTLVPA